MKKIIAILVVVIGFAFNTNAQDKMMKKENVKTVSLEQTKGEFTQKQITLSEGTYIFEISNNNVGKNVGFVLQPKGKNGQENHIKEAYVKALVKNNTKQISNEVTLKKGTYTYFCPLNKTPEYTLIVE
ncbi:plastocyanin/azurin family copper-binding protein [Polaribacter porphyrae]|uniref:Blue (type 1) copper domain-containing protein n=1 Tax=Polaribacter porphyrae TaxID=1137780 RepID=A0A2S7WS46_9FLAO|nr:plastocyanin/azurin family copper-binding protein [Polaribacter porphyrae]PQJ80141.1 hypothetical protein BTO18_13570 [Polaribacter porphyrae]